MRTEIDKNKTLSPGDIIELEFSSPGSVFWKSLQMALIESKINQKHPEYTMLHYHFEDNDKKIVYRFQVEDRSKFPPEVQEAGGPSPAMIITAIVIIAGGFFLWLTAGKVYQITEEINKSPAW